VSRFDRLEIKPQDPEPPAPAGGNPHEPDAGHDDLYHLREAVTALQRGNAERGLHHFSRVLGLNRQNAAAWVGQLRCLLMLGEYDEVCLWADKALAVLPDHPEVLAAKAAALGRLGEFNRAVGLSDLSIKSAQQGGWFIWWARGDVFSPISFEKAQFCFNKARESAPLAGDVLMNVEIARSFLSAELYPEAIAMLRRAEEADPDNPCVPYYLGLALGLSGRRDDALRTIERCLQHDPHPALREEAIDLRMTLKKALFLRRAVARFIARM
jgi:tetratricopeptide (TPR) repeat protein